MLDLDARDDPIHGAQEGRFFHGYYGCYCYLPLYVFSGKHLLAAKLRRANIDAAAGAVEEVARIVAQIRARWPQVRIILRADSGFAREALMAWCEGNNVDYLFGLARNVRLVEAIAAELAASASAASRSPWPPPIPAGANGRSPTKRSAPRADTNQTAHRRHHISSAAEGGPHRRARTMPKPRASGT